MDTRANLFQEYLRILAITRPKIFLFENVVGKKPIPRQQQQRHKLQ
ncbi:DNA cytosine methyltransferase [Helicobacter suis]